MEEAEDTPERREDVMRIVRWGLEGLALAAMACWSVLVLVFACGGALYWSEQGLALGNSVILPASALALAPWVIGGIVFGARRWRSQPVKNHYPKFTREGLKALQRTEGQVVERVLVHVVADGFNMLFLEFSDGVYRALGTRGGEILGFYRSSEIHKDDVGPSESRIRPYKPFEVFIGKTVASTRHIGSAWNGHGFEISFQEIPEKTLIVQSIHTDPVPEGRSHCIRLGIGNYSYNVEDI